MLSIVNHSRRRTLSALSFWPDRRHFKMSPVGELNLLQATDVPNVPMSNSNGVTNSVPAVLVADFPIETDSIHKIQDSWLQQLHI